MNRLPQIDNLTSNPLNFSRFIDGIPIGIIILDKDRRVIALNRSFEALSGFSISMARGVPCSNILRSSACVNNCPVIQAGKKGQNVSCKSDMINLDRILLPIRINAAPIFDNQGNINGYFETITDLSRTEMPEEIKNSAYSFEDIVGRSPIMDKIFQTIPLIAQSDTTVLITGESGTGKDLVAEAIHKTSDRASAPFIKINCGALPEALLESEIFGHEKGAFTGAVDNKPGRFKLAHNGTIFLTEIGDLPLSLQVKLLTFLDDKIIYPLGSTKGFSVNVRIITATHRNLEKMVKEGTFRQDLFFRLNVAKIHLPPLREREGDVRLLIDHFLHKFTTQLKKQIKGFSQDTLNFLVKHRFSGNVRELKNIIEYSVNMATGSSIRVENLPSYLFDSQVFESVDDREGEEAEVGVSVLKTDSSKTWANTEREMIMNALVRAKGKKMKAAEILGWGRSTLWRKIRMYGIDE